MDAFSSTFCKFVYDSTADRVVAEDEGRDVDRSLCSSDLVDQGVEGVGAGVNELGAVSFCTYSKGGACCIMVKVFGTEVDSAFVLAALTDFSSAE